MRDPEVETFRTFFELFRQRVNFGRKQKDDLKNFVPDGHPTLALGKITFISKDPWGSRGPRTTGLRGNFFTTRLRF